MTDMSTAGPIAAVVILVVLLVRHWHRPHRPPRAKSADKSINNNAPAQAITQRNSASLRANFADPCPQCGQQVGLTLSSCPHCNWTYTERPGGSVRAARPTNMLREEYDA
jgi:hypothetical protein